MKQKELNKIVENHRHWLNKDVDGWENMKADLRGAYLRGAYLRGAKNLDSVTYNEQTSFFCAPMSRNRCFRCLEEGVSFRTRRFLHSGTTCTFRSEAKFRNIKEMQGIKSKGFEHQVH